MGKESWKPTHCAACTKRKAAEGRQIVQTNKTEKNQKNLLTNEKRSDIINKLSRKKEDGGNLENRTTGNNDDTNGFVGDTNLKKISLIPKREQKTQKQ